MNQQTAGTNPEDKDNKPLSSESPANTDTPTTTTPPANTTTHSHAEQIPHPTPQHEPSFIFSDSSWAILVLRAWIGLRLILAGIVKFKHQDADGAIHYSKENYANWAENAGRPFIEFGGLPANLVLFQSGIIAYLLLASGIMVLFGITNRIALLFASLVFITISFGLFTLDDSPEIAYIGIHIALCAIALALAKHNRLCILKNW